MNKSGLNRTPAQSKQTKQGTVKGAREVAPRCCFHTHKPPKQHCFNQTRHNSQTKGVPPQPQNNQPAKQHKRYGIEHFNPQTAQTKNHVNPTKNKKRHPTQANKFFTNKHVNHSPPNPRSQNKGPWTSSSPPQPPPHPQQHLPFPENVVRPSKRLPTLGFAGRLCRDSLARRLWVPSSSPRAPPASGQRGWGGLLVGNPSIRNTAHVMCFLLDTGNVCVFVGNWECVRKQALRVFQTNGFLNMSLAFPRIVS